MKTSEDKLKEYETILRVIRRYFIEQALIGQEVDVLRDICSECYELTLQSREFIKEIDKVLKGRDHGDNG